MNAQIQYPQQMMTQEPICLRLALCLSALALTPKEAEREGLKPVAFQGS